MTPPDILDVIDTRPTPAFAAWMRDQHSQCGEDGILAELLARLVPEERYFVEFGAWDGKHLSNCAALAEQGFSGCFIEGDGIRHQDLLANWGHRADIACLHALVGATGENRLDALLGRVGAPAEPTVLSIDIDGMDYHVWAALTAYKPLICLVEFNPTIPAHVAYVQPADFAVHRGCSLAALWQLGKSKGYELVAATELNGIFVRADRCAAAGLETYTPEAIKSRRYETALFHGFDGHMVAAGHRMLLWHGVHFGADDLQVLPDPLQRFPIGAPQSYFDALGPIIERSRTKAQA